MQQPLLIDGNDLQKGICSASDPSAWCPTTIQILTPYQPDAQVKEQVTADAVAGSHNPHQHQIVSNGEQDCVLGWLLSSKASAGHFASHGDLLSLVSLCKSQQSS